MRATNYLKAFVLYTVEPVDKPFKQEMKVLYEAHS